MDLIKQLSTALIFTGKGLTPDRFVSPCGDLWALGIGNALKDFSSIQMILTMPSFPGRDKIVTVYENENGARSPLREINPELAPDGMEIVYSRVFKLLEDRKSGIPGALFPRMGHNNMNHVKVVFYDIQTNEYEVWEVGLCSQNGHVYFAKQMTRSGKADFAKLPELPPVERKNEKANLPDNVGQTVYFNLLSGTGCIATNQGLSAIYWKEVGGVGFRALKAGDYVVFGKLATSPGAFPCKVEDGAERFSHLPDAEEIGWALASLAGNTTMPETAKPLTHNPFANLK